MKITNRSQFSADVIKFAAGAAQHGASFPALTAILITVPDDLSTLLGKSKKQDQLFQDCKAARRTAFAEQANCKLPSQRWIGTARDALVPFLSRTWNERWAQAGWIAPGSIAVPDSLPQILDLLERLEGFLTKNPRYQNAEPDVKVTAAQAKAYHTALGKCVTDVSQAKSQQRACRDARELADTALAEKWQAGRAVLAIEMKPEDPRWLDFINQVPADLERPEVAEDVEVEAGLPGRVIVRWEPSERAESYEVEAQVTGQDAEFRSVATVQDPVANLTLPPGRRVKVRVIARNSTGPAVPSEAVEATVPAEAAA